MDGFWERTVEYFFVVFFINIIPTGLSVVLAYFITARFLKPRREKLRRFALLLALFLGTCMIIYVGDPDNILGTLPFFIAGIVLGCEGSRMSRYSFSLIFFTICMSFNALIDSFVKEIHNSGLWIRVGFWFILWLMLRKVLTDVDSRPPLSTKMWLLVDVLALMPFAAVLSTVVLDTEIFSMNLQALIVLPFALLSSLGLLMAVVVLSRHEKLIQEKTLWQMRSLYYQNLEQEQQQVRRLRHDMANHLQTMLHLNEPAARTYLHELVSSPAMNTGRRFCANEVINAVLSSKVPQIEESGIRAEIKVSVPNELPVAEIDLCALFANSLDNAIESCLKLSPEVRFLSFQACVEKGLLMFHLQNSMTSVQTHHGKLISTKDDQMNHGFGLVNIKDIVSRYHGSIEISYTDTIFSVLLSLPV